MSRKHARERASLRKVGVLFRWRVKRRNYLMLKARLERVLTQPARATE